MPTPEQWDCIKGSVSEALGLEIINGLVWGMAELGVKKFIKEAAKTWLEKALKHIAKKTLPFLALLILAKLIWDIAACLGLVAGLDDVIAWLKDLF